jgi:hypothetical protein
MEYLMLAGLFYIIISHFFLQDTIKELDDRIEQLENKIFPDGMEE